MPDTIKRTVRIITRQEVIPDEPPIQEGFPMRKWSISICMLNDLGQEVPAVVFDRATYKLHPTFVNPVRALKEPPFLLEERGWGEFDLKITLHVIARGGEHTLTHDLNFRQNMYVADHIILFPTNKPALTSLLAQSGPVPGALPELEAPLNIAAEQPADLSLKRPAEQAEDKPKSKKQRTLEKGNVDLEQLAQGLEKLNEEDLLGVVQMVTDNKTSEMYIKNDADAGEFHMDLYTLPDRLLKSLWDYVKRRVPA